MSYQIRNIAAVSLFVISLGIPAEVLAEDVKDFCSGYTLDNDALAALPKLAGLSQGIVTNFCAGELSSARSLSIELLDLIAESNDQFKSFGITERIFPFRADVTLAKSEIENGQAIVNMARWPNPTQAGIRFYNDILVADLDACNTAVQKAFDERMIGVKSCKEFLDNYQRIYSYAQLLVQKQYTAPVKKYLELSQVQWDDFFKKSRSQAGWEMAINSYLWRKDKRAGIFLAPPKMNWIIFHPSIVVENVSKALDGSQTQGGVLVEAVGVNWWERDKWYQLSGASIVGLYSDRANTSDWGGGLALHFGNKLTFGAVNHGGSNGFFISVDVLEFYKDKRSLMDGYIGKLSI